MPDHDQSGYRVRCEWGAVGGSVICRPGDVAVVVDVLSFSTTTTVALARGIEVYPFEWADERASTWARAHDAVLACDRSLAVGRPGAISLSPASMAGAVGPSRVVLPSPNGATVCRALDRRGARVVAGSLRNASAVGRHLAGLVARGGSACLVPAGERWPDGSLRPAQEDLWGAGAVLAGAVAAGLPEETMSPEARAAVAAYRAAVLPRDLFEVVSGVELVDAGWREDVAMAARSDRDDVVPVLVAGAFRLPAG